jgi:hypothetical protein
MSIAEANMATDDEKILKMILRITARELGEEICFSTYRSALGLLVKGAFSAALGPVAFVLPLEDVITFATKLGYRYVQGWRQARVAGVVYDYETTKSGVTRARVSDPATLTSMPVPLPKEIEISTSDLFRPMPEWQQQFPFLNQPIQRMCH